MEGGCIDKYFYIFIIQEKMIGIYVGTKYTLLISLIKFYDLKSEIIYFLDKGLKIEKEYLNLKNFKVIFIEEFNNENSLVKKYNRWKFNKILLKNLEKIGSLYLQDHLSYGQFFLNNFRKHMCLLEDGLMNYNIKILETEQQKKLPKIKLKNFISKRIIEKRKKYYKIYGLSGKIDKIYLTGILPIPDLIKEKVEIINIEEKWNNLSFEKRKEILDIFNIKLEKLEKLKEDQEKVLLITQPLSEDGIMPENEKIEIYKTLLKERNIKKIYIKPHPREKTDYEKEFKEFNIVLLGKEFPIEIFMLLDMNFKKVITLFSTAALNFKHKYQIEFIGTKNYPKLYEKFGNIEI